MPVQEDALSYCFATDSDRWTCPVPSLRVTFSSLAVLGLERVRLVWCEDGMTNATKTIS